MKKTLLVIFFILTAFSSKATHIVGGEFEMIYRGTNPLTGDNLYNISLILYFDEIHGSDSARDRTVNIRIFRMRDNAIMENSIMLSLFRNTDVEYLQPECSSGNSIETNRLYYTYLGSNGQPALYALAPDRYADELGYYMAWERCCRNYQIANIFSQNPEKAGSIYAGQTFYLEFPPLLTKGGELFINSSPRLFPPLSDYACVGSLYYVDFAGNDPDNDSLVYTLVTPLNTITGDALPTSGLPHAGPYPNVSWRKKYGLDSNISNIRNIMNGAPDLKISTDGLLTVVPQKIGLYVFSIKCEEFRKGVRIGEVRRDFQMLVRKCDPPHKPKVEVKKKGSPVGDYTADKLNLSYATMTVTEGDRCVNVRVSDPGAPQNDNKEDSVSIRAIPIGFKNKELNDEVISSAVLGSDGYAYFNICFPDCPYVDREYTIGIIAGNNTCPLPTLDTVYVKFNITPPPNNEPVFDKFITEKIITNGSYSSLDVTGIDIIDLDRMTLTIEPYGFALADYGFQFINTIDEAGKIQYQLTFDARCGVIDFTHKKEFEFKFTLNDEDQCDLYPPAQDTLTLHLEEPPENSPPRLKIKNLNNNSAPVIDSISYIIGQEINLELTGIDLDTPLDNLKINLIKFDSSTAQLDYKFTANNALRVANFLWQPDCSIYKNKKFVNDYTFYFSVTDGRCYKPKGDTIQVQISIRDIDNESTDFIPPNFISPNGDGFNDYFAMVKVEPTTKALVSILPKDNCAGRFVNIHIYNRWGREVFLSTNRDFKWYAQDAAVGVYFYTLFFSDKEYKGTITVRQ